MLHIDHIITWNKISPMIRTTSIVALGILVVLLLIYLKGN